MEKYLVVQYQQVILGSTNAQYFTQRTDKAWLLTADVDGIPFIEAYSYTDNNQYQNDPIGIRTNTTGSHGGYNIFAASSKNGTRLNVFNDNT